MGDQEEDYSSLPLTERWTHKIWKVRKQAYEDAAKDFQKSGSESDPIFKPFLQDSSLIKGAILDSNVAAQQDGIVAVCGFLEFGGHTATRNQSVPALIEKGLSSTRAITKTKSLEAILLYIELDIPGPIIDEMIPFLSHKQPKIIAATLAALTAIFHAYGCKTVDPKAVLKVFSKVFGHADKNVRAESQTLALELYRWLREAMKPMFWSELKPVQQKELEEAFEKIQAEPNPKQERFLRTQQAAAAAGGDDEGEDLAEEVVEVDAFDLAEPVNVLPKVPQDLHENLSSSKWKERKDALDALYAVLNIPRIKDGDFNEIVRALAKCMKDANIAVVTVAANCIEALASGLRKGFSKHRTAVMSAMLERLKEKKQSVADAIGAALDAVFKSSTLSECLEDITEFLKHKNPQVKQETLKFLIRALSTTPTVPSKNEVKSLADTLLKLTADTSPDTRNSAAEGLGTLMKIIGERPMNPYLESADEARKTKIKEFFDKAQVKAKDKPAPPSATITKAPVGKKPAPKKVVGGTKKAAPSSASAPASAPLTPKLASRTVPSKLTGPGKSSLPGAPGTGLKLQKKLTGPGGAPPPNIPSPRRPAVQQPLLAEDDPIAPPKSGLASRGLAGRSLAKPGLQQPVAEPSASQHAYNELSTAERMELDALRLFKESNAKIIEDFKFEKSRLTSQLHELQNQNAQLIEDHTRDVLSIKAKETQLVRARSDAEAAEQTVVRQQREIDRLKRELSRAVRATSPPPVDMSEQIYKDTGLNGLGRQGDEGVGAYSRRAGIRMSYNSALSEEKENSVNTSAYRDSKHSPTLSSTAGSGTLSPTRTTRDARESGSGEGIESWKRAAEVTSQLKARIEQMKARQGISKH